MTAQASPVSLQHFPDIAANRERILDSIARHGTPVFLGDRAILLDRYRDLERVLEETWPRHAVAYSFKTNYQVVKSGILDETSCLAEVVSGFEYELARAAGYEGSSIVFNGPCKRDDELRRAIGEGALINVNDHGELDRILAMASGGQDAVRIGLRLSCSLPKLGESRFGFSLDNDEARLALAKISGSASVRLSGLHMHLYGDTDDAQIYAEAARRLGRFVSAHASDMEHPLTYVDMGGGFPANSPRPYSRDAWSPQPIETYVEAIVAELRRAFPHDDDAPTLILEPGRYLTSDAIVLVTRVEHVNQRGGRQIVNCDASISMLPLTHYRPQILRAYSPELAPRLGNTAPTTVHGATCRENDILFDGDFARVRPGDYLVYFAAGAYNSSLSPTFIFRVPDLVFF